MNWQRQYWTAWKCWRHADSAAPPVNSLPLFGKTVGWWGRLGKGLELLSGLSILVELIGPDHLRGAGHSMSLLLPDISTPHASVRNALVSAGVVLVLALVAAGLAALLPIDRRVQQRVRNLTPRLGLAVLAVVWFFELVFVYSPELLAGGAALLEHERLSDWVKLSSLLLLVVGFHFDLLAS